MRHDPWHQDLVIEHCGKWRCVNHCDTCEVCQFLHEEARVEAREVIYELTGE